MPSERALRVAAAALAIAGLGVAAYIVVADACGGAPGCLAGGHGCATVANSRYSHIGGVNVAVFGVVGYALLLAAALTSGDLGRFGGFTGALIGFGFSAYLTYLELFVINAICQWCVASAVLMALILCVNVARALRYGAVGPELREDADQQGLDRALRQRS